MAAARSLRLLAAVLIVVIAGPGLAEGAVHGEVPNLIETCGSRLNWIYSTRYPAPRSPGELNCSSVITKALESRDTQSCPAEADLVKCFNRARAIWVAFVKDCELFSEPPPCASQQGQCVKPGSDPSAQNSTSPAKAAGENKRKAKAEGEAEGRRHLLSYRRLFAEGEGEGGSELAYGPPGCFPDFYSAQDFDDWLQGKYIVPDYARGAKVGPGGIIVWIIHSLSILAMAFM